MASHGYALATRFGLDEPASTAHLRTARALADALGMGYTAIRDGGGLDTGFKLAIEQGLIPGPRLTLGLQILSPTGGIGDRVSPSGHSPASLGCCGGGGSDPLLPRNIANGPDEVREVIPHPGPRRRRRDQDRLHGRGQLARGAWAAGCRLHAGGAAGAGGGVARAGTARDVPRAGGPGAPHRAPRRRGHHRARLLSRRGAGADGPDGGRGHLLRPHAHGLRLSPAEPRAARARAGRRPLPASPRQHQAGARAGGAHRRGARTRAGMGIPRTRSS
jgi:hypothetical protein